MSDNSQKDEGGWKDQAGLRDDTARVVAYPPTHVKHRWEEKSGSQSLSSWIQEQVVKAELGAKPSSSSSSEEKQRLKNRIEELEHQLNQQKTSSNVIDTGTQQVVSDETLLKILDKNAGSKIHELVQEVIESGEVNIASIIESQLYELADQDKVKYRRSNPHGWHTAENYAGEETGQ